ncbi:hypothetical protein COB64_00135 [Candidatus Wolfebacteria bacterium]|nr:MAG: hypothetical protein COB64_00135 [Candidatus Wolfebacteria bacterium]
MADENEKTNRIRDIKKKLNQRADTSGIQPRKRKVLKPHEHEVPTDWKDATKVEKKKSRIKYSSLFKKFFIYSIIFLGVAVVFSGIKFLSGSNTVSNKNIDIEVLGNAFTSGGEELALQIDVVNRNSAALEFSDLLIEYPKGSIGDTEGDFERIRVSLGTIDPGKTATENIDIVLFGKQNTTKDVRITLEYRVKGSNAIFVREEIYPVTISSSPVSLSIEGPLQTSPSQEVTLKIKTVLNAEEIIKDMRLKVEYPPGFEFISASPSPVLRDNLWDLGDVSPGTSKTVTVKGIINGQDGEERTFRVFAGNQDSKDPSAIGVVFNSLSHTVAITRPFIEAALLINNVNKDEHAVSSQSEIRGSIAWANNLQSEINDVQIEVKITGNALDKNTVRPQNGFYSSSNNTITWDQNSLGQLASIDPGERGTVDFTFNSLPLFSGGSILSNPQIVLEVSIRGREALGSVAREVINTETKIVKIASNLQIAGKALYFDGPFANTGPLPPKVDIETTYTITWNLTNSSNRITGVTAKATLPSYIRYVNAISPSSENVTFDSLSREVTWNVGTVNSGTGLLGGTKEVSFQIGFLPSLSQLGSSPVLISETVLSGRDTFTNTTIRSTKRQLNTLLTNDSGFASPQDRVVQ